MTTEEKAKAYDEAIERAKTKLTNEVASYIFPALKESEDEGVKNEIVAFIEQSIHRGGGTPIPQEQENKWLAWLEKQGEQKNTWSEEDSDMVDDIVKSLKKYQLQMPNYRVELQMRWLNYLKFIRTWKPSEGQMSALKEQCVCKKSTVAGAVLCELFHDLEKLRGE